MRKSRWEYAREISNQDGHVNLEQKRMDSDGLICVEYYEFLAFMSVIPENCSIGVSISHPVFVQCMPAVMLALMKCLLSMPLSMPRRQ